MAITPIQLAEKYLGEYRIKDNEINVKVCPFCKPQKKDDFYKFYVNQQTGVFDCKRANSCGKSGSFYELCQHFNIEDQVKRQKKPPAKKEYKKPKVKLKDISSKKTKDYLKLRGFSPETINFADVKEKGGNIAFEYYLDGELVLVKYRNTARGDNKSYWQEGGGRPVLYNMQNCTSAKPLVIVEGEMDALAVIESGYQNVVSVPFGADNLKWIQECWEFLDEFEQVKIWADNDKAGKEMQDNVIKRLGRWRCYTVNADYKDANELLHFEDRTEVRAAIETAEAVPIKRVLRLDEIESVNLADIESIRSNIPLINKYLGGYMMGLITVWTGTSGSGKSTFLGQQALEAVEQDKGCCLVSGELPHWLVKNWLQLQAAGPGYFHIRYDEIRDKETTYVKSDIKQKINEWAGDRLLIYDSFDSLKTTAILEVFENVYRRYGIKQFIVDNLMVVNYDLSGRYNKYDRQAEFVNTMKEFAKKYEVHIHIVAHPRKPEGGIVTKQDIAGLSEIHNWADNVVGVHRVTDKNRKCFEPDEQDADNILDIFKSRIYGQQDISIKLGFEELTKRFYQHSGKGYEKKYGWE